MKKKALRERLAEEVAHSARVRANLTDALEALRVARKGEWRPLGDNASPKRSYYWWAEIIADGKTVRSGPLEMVTINPGTESWQIENWLGVLAFEQSSTVYNVKFLDDETTYEVETGFGSTVTLRHEVRS